MWMIPCCALVSLDPEGLWNKEILTIVYNRITIDNALFHIDRSSACKEKNAKDAVLPYRGVR
ncbi:hypothetical protein M758_6G194500 [Ceratodon purpureus]|uniref:Uncharacterized protein n=1 Tax=Ceratodon purpureus TaxID=3225 RepID=A0A8T0HJM8_CERPU|nr:hypothetical protein KC19_6G203200 [Ceratodon purpureus]KAG0614666.1 hypothetical protein M758_6G194500 [Ceratodon purpureus]